MATAARAVVRPRRPPWEVGLLLALLEAIARLIERYPLAACIAVGSVIGVGMGWLLFELVR